MNQKMTKWGVGPKFAVISWLYTAIVFAINYIYFPNTSIPLPYNLSLILGITLMIIGVIVFLTALPVMRHHFANGKLATSGVYAYFRHPIYAAWIVFLVPGTILLCNALLGLSIPIFMYIIFKILIIKEEKYLENKFGEEYFKYKKGVGAIFPKLF